MADGFFALRGGGCRWLMHDEMLGSFLLWEFGQQIQAVRGKVWAVRAKIWAVRAKVRAVRATVRPSGPDVRAVRPDVRAVRARCPGCPGQSPGRPCWGDQKDPFWGDQNDPSTCPLAQNFFYIAATSRDGLERSSPTECLLA